MNDTRPYIYFVPVGGLGNRMRSIESAIRYADACNSQLEIGWYQDWGMGCKFSDIFKPLRYEVKEESGIRKYLLDRPRKKNLFLPLLYEKLVFDVILTEFEIGYRWFGTPLDGNQKNWMASCQSFYKKEDADYNIFRPIDSLQEQIDEIIGKFPKKVVGFQIRRTDHVIAKQSSPTACFEKILKGLDDETKVYLATDDEQEKNYFVKKYGDKIIIRESRLERGSKQGIQDAVVEMFVLSATNRIYGSKTSSFGEVASKIGKIEFVEVQNEIC